MGHVPPSEVVLYCCLYVAVSGSVGVNCFVLGAVMKIIDLTVLTIKKINTDVII